MEYRVPGPLSQQKSSNCHNSPLHALQCPHITSAILFRFISKYVEYRVPGPLSQQKSSNCHNFPLHALQCPHITSAILFRDVITDKAYPIY